MRDQEDHNVMFTKEAMQEYKVMFNASHREMKKFSTFVRSKHGRGAVPAYCDKYLSEQSKVLEEVYQEGVFEFDIEGKDDKEESKKELRPVIFADASELLVAVCEKRGISAYDVELKLLTDGGQDFYKMCLSIIPKEFIEVDECEFDAEDKEVSKKTRKLMGVKKLIMLCRVPKIKETYSNLQLLFNLTKVRNILCKLIADFKLILLING